MRRSSSWIIVLSLTTALACDSAEPTGPGLAPTTTQAAITGVPGVTEVVGETGPGAEYALFLPADWNGTLVVYVHGYIQPFLPPSLPDEPLLAPVRDQLLADGYGFAYSGWSETGYAIKDATLRSHEVRGLFTDAFGPPERTLLWGLSLGALAGERLSERHPGIYDGTLAVCGALGGGLWNAEYVAHFRVLFDHFFPGVLQGTLYDMPEGYLVIGPDPATGYPGSEAFWAIYGALLADLPSAMEMAGMDQIQLQWNHPGELIESFLKVLGYQVNGANALTERLNGHSFFHNVGLEYTGSSDDEAVNAGVARFAADPAAVAYFHHWWEPTGQLEDPFVTLHTTRDPLVPFAAESRFADRVDAAGAGTLLLQREVEAFGHCQIDAADVLDAFDALVEWVDTGVRPAS